MNNLRIVFIGTPDFAVGGLQHLVESKLNVVGVVTVCDKPAGRGRKLRESAVKQYAQSQKIPVLQPKNLKSKEFLKQLKAFKADIQVVIAFRMLPKVVWQMPKYGTFNLHTSLLPEYRGSAPINWVLINGETKTGVTTFFINEEIDTGNIIMQQEVAIKDTETYGELHDKLKAIGAKLVVKTIELIHKNNGFPPTIKQPKKGIKTAPKMFVKDCEIEWDKPLDEIYNFVRGLNPYPTARTTIVNGNNKTDIKIFAVDKQYIRHNYKIGKIITTKEHIKIAVKEGFLIVKEAQLSGKKKLTSKSLLNGYTFYEDAEACNIFTNKDCNCY